MSEKANETEENESGKWLVIIGEVGDRYKRLVEVVSSHHNGNHVQGNVWIIDNDSNSIGNNWDTAKELREELEKDSEIPKDKARLIVTWYFSGDISYSDHRRYEEFI
ncbi:MAG: hypothetical protein OXK73_00180 [Rhodospirillaceae bacterium]|nr:hypothetical protein [Rhodospirillaceae bacterium]